MELADFRALSLNANSTETPTGHMRLQDGCSETFRNGFRNASNILPFRNIFRNELILRVILAFLAIRNKQASSWFRDGAYFATNLWRGRRSRMKE